MPEELANVALVQLELASVEEIYSVEEIAEGSVFSPVLAVWLGKQSIQEIADNTNYYERKYEEDYYFMQSSRLVIHSYQIAEFQSYFIDKGAGTDLVNVASLEAALEKLNRFEFAVYRVDYQELTAQQYLRIADCQTGSYERDSWAESLSLEIIDRTPVSIQRTTDRLGARPMCAGINYEYDGSNYWEEDGSQSVRVFREDDGFLVSGDIATGETSECPFMPQFDRLLFAEMCGEQEYNVIGQLLITDNVDTSKPIIVRMGLQGAEERLLFYETDISVDGTYVSTQAAPIGAYAGEGMYYFNPHPNNWFFAPGVVQSSIQTAERFGELSPLPAIFQVSYTDIYGNRQTTSNSVISQLSCCWSDQDYVWRENYGFDGRQFHPIVRSENELAGVLSTTMGGYHQYDPGTNPTLSRFYTTEWYTPAANNAVPLLDMSLVEALFRSESSQNRRILQDNLRTLGFYRSSIDGQWGRGTAGAFQALFDYLNQYYPDRTYITDYGFDDGQITRGEFVQFWNAMYSCEPGSLLSITSACGN